MAAVKKRTILTIGALIAPTILALSQAAPDKSPTKPNPEEKILQVLNDLYNEKYPLTNVPQEDGKLLRILAESMGAKRVVEIGTANGCSALWFALALRTTGGKLITHEIDDHRAALARNNFKKAGVDKFITIVEGDAHKTVTNLEAPIDILFLDADKKGNLDYLEKLLPKIRPGGLIIAHNTTTHAQDIKPYLEEVTNNPNLQTILLNKKDQGIALTLKKRHHLTRRPRPAGP
ncbi:MAG: O-methyltransferase [Planctomycetota bacterium]